jgi:hypothetical protein
MLKDQERLKELNDKEAKIKLRLQAIQKSKKTINQRKADNQRKAETRFKILIGAVVINKSSQEQLSSYVDEMSDKDKKFVTEYMESIK